MLERALNSKTLKDGLSGPLTIASLIIQWVFSNSPHNEVHLALEALETGEPLHIVVVGATAVYEEVRVRVLRLFAFIFVHSR